MSLAPLAEIYAAFIRDPPGGLPALVAGLEQAEHWVEAEWLAAHADGRDPGLVTQPFSRHLGRRLWIAPDPPGDAAAGDVWFDVVEIMPMILLPSEPLGWREEKPLVTYPPLQGWLACRPVAPWQYDGYRILTDQAGRDDPGAAWAAGVSQEEAVRYARHAGKTLATSFEWQAATEFVSAATLDDLWSEQFGEWSGERSDYDEELAFVVRRDTFDLDLDDILDAHELEGGQDPRGWTVFSRNERQAGIGFRTTVNLQIGLMSRGGSA